MSTLDDPAVRWRGRGTLRADQLYARLPATAVQLAAGGLPTPRAGLRSADGALEAVPLDRWLAPTTRRTTASSPARSPRCSTWAAGPAACSRRSPRGAKEALGVDLVPATVGIAPARDGQVLVGSISPTSCAPAAWRTALVFDGEDEDRWFARLILPA